MFRNLGLFIIDELMLSLLATDSARLKDAPSLLANQKAPPKNQ